MEVTAAKRAGGDDGASGGGRKRRKQQKAAAADAGAWERCMFRIERKNRFCNIQRVAGSQFCGNHLPEGDAGASKRSQKFKAAARRRVPCPIDKAHSVYEFDLEKHVLVCNRVKDAEAMKRLPFYLENVNSGTHAAAAAAGEVKAVQVEDAKQSNEAESASHSEPTAQQQQGLVDKLLAIDFADLRKRIESAFETCVGEIPLEKLHHSCCDALLEEKKQTGASKSVLRHIEQQASILEHMARSKLLDDANAAFIELGAGRGMLSLALAQLLPSSLFVLIDRAHSRGKADHFIGGEADDKRNVMRAKIDIRHLNFAGMVEIRDKPVVGMSKHLCGVATDLSLRALAQTLPRGASTESPSSPSFSSQFSGLAIALCCHHVCAWEDYINPSFFLSQGFSADEFELLTGMTSWTTCGMGLEGDAVEFTLGISKSDRAVLGRKCKRILDAGRAAFLAQHQLKTRLVHYCEQEDSLENCLLLAWREKS